MTTITALPTPPSRSDPVNFAARGDAFLGALPTFATETNLVASEVNTNATNAATSASTASTAATTAQSAASAASAAANFKGLWNTLTGALNKPASVKHNNRFWLLLNNLADVTLSEPGVSADWTASDTGTDITQTITTTTTAVAGVTYLIDATSIELDLPTTGLSKGDFVGLCLLAVPGTQTVDTGGVKVNKQTMDANKILLNAKGASFRFVYEDATIGWWLK
jgi:hypothetical protein